MGAFSFFEINGHYLSLADFHHIHLCYNAQTFRGESNGAGLGHLIAEFFGGGQLLSLFVDPFMSAFALSRVSAVGPFSLNPFKIGKPRTIYPLVHHSCGDKRSVFVNRRRR